MSLMACPNALIVRHETESFPLPLVHDALAYILQSSTVPAQDVQAQTPLDNAQKKVNLEGYDLQELVIPVETDQIAEYFQKELITIPKLAFLVSPIAQCGAAGFEMLAYLKNYGCPSICSFEPIASDKDFFKKDKEEYCPTNMEQLFTSYLSLAFQQGPGVEWLEKHYQCYHYDISRYNFKRSWNNPKFWANPENFNRYRW